MCRYKERSFTFIIIEEVFLLTSNLLDTDQTWAMSLLNRLRTNPVIRDSFIVANAE
jgi:hypothetical protein